MKTHCWVLLLMHLQTALFLQKENVKIFMEYIGCIMLFWWWTDIKIYPIPSPVLLPKKRFSTFVPLGRLFRIKPLLVTRGHCNLVIFYYLNEISLGLRSLVLVLWLLNMHVKKKTTRIYRTFLKTEHCGRNYNPFCLILLLSEPEGKK